MYENSRTVGGILMIFISINNINKFVFGVFRFSWFITFFFIDFDNLNQINVD